MKGNGNNLVTLLQKILFFLIPNSGRRSEYIYKHKKQFKKMGGGIFFQSRSFPSDPELISFGNNVKVSSSVQFINHDIIPYMLNESKLYDTTCCSHRGCIEIGDNVVIGSHVIILPNVRIGSNVIIGAGSVVTKDIPPNSVAAGVPCRVIKTFDSTVKKYLQFKNLNTEELWDSFYAQRTNSELFDSVEECKQ